MISEVRMGRASVFIVKPQVLVSVALNVSELLKSFDSHKLVEISAPVLATLKFLCRSVFVNKSLCDITKGEVTLYIITCANRLTLTPIIKCI